MDGDCATGTIVESWLFSYDGDGNRVAQLYTDLSTSSTLTTLYYFGGAYEVTLETGAVRKYYSFAGQTIAMRDDDGLKYFLTDHLGSIITVLDESGEVISQQRYLPFGQVREDVGNITQTDFSYTGQRSLPETGLMDYRARFYSSALGRFIQPDTLIPGAANPQAWNRYSYVLNMPINANDPTGHKCVGEPGECLKADGKKGGGFTYVEPNRSSKPSKTCTGKKCGGGDDGIGTPSVTPTVTPTATPTIPSGLLSTPTPCISFVAAACVPTATTTPTQTPSPYAPFGQRAGETLANGVVNAASTAVPLFLGPPSGGPSLGQDLVNPLLQGRNPNAGYAIDLGIGMYHFPRSVADRIANGMIQSWQTMTPQERTQVTAYTVVAIFILVPVVPP
jgi:RHS repeat-associated protein